MANEAPFWSLTPDAALRALQSQPEGLSSEEARARLARYGPNQIKASAQAAAWRLLLGQFTSPLVLMLLVAAGLSVAVGSHEDTLIILGIVLLSGLLGFFQEHSANQAVARLLAQVAARPTVRRDGQPTALAAEAVVPGDVLVLSAGALIPADALLLDARDLHVDEAALTGETFPVEKEVGPVPADAPAAARQGALFMGTHVVSGTATALVTSTGSQTVFGQLAGRLSHARGPTEFEQGVQHFGYLLMRVTVVLVLVIFAINVGLHHPALEAFLFSLALAVGLVPELLPVIVSTTLAAGARRMAKAQVIVKRLSAIESLGSMDVICSDKTGTLTEGRIHVEAALGVEGEVSPDVLQHAAWNAALEAGLANPIDEAIRAACPVAAGSIQKLDELPYDFQRRRLSVFAAVAGERRLITKGAVASVLAVCSAARMADGSLRPLSEVQSAIDARFIALSDQGLRTLGVAVRALPDQDRVSKTDEQDMIFLGFLALLDPPRADSAETVAALRQLGVQLRIITGDNARVAATVARRIGVADPVVMTGAALHATSDTALVQRARGVDVFAEIEPDQKERIVRALRRSGCVVGYMGDGINDAPALQAADVGISVHTAVDVAREAADLVMLQSHLGVLVDAVQEGRRTFENTLKYVLITTSANFGNMLSMAVAAVFLPFLPLLPKQILLNNFLSDFPAMAIGGDQVDADQVARPHRWDIGLIRRSMFVLGGVSSIFDLLTFGALLGLGATEGQFRTGWFFESLMSEILILLVVRTRRPLFKSRPSRAIIGGTVGVTALSLLLIYTPLGGPFGLEPVPLPIFGVLLLITLGYLITSELAKQKVFQVTRRG